MEAREIPSPYDRPDEAEVFRLCEETDRRICDLDTPGDIIAETLDRQLREFDGPIPDSRSGLRIFVLSQFRSASGPTAVSAMLENYIETEETAIRADAIRRMLTVIRSQPRPALTCDALSVAIGIHIGEGRSLEEIAKAHKVTKQALSKRAIRICADLGLPPSRLQRDDDARESYRLKQLERHSAARSAGQGHGSFAAIKAKLKAAREHVSGATLRAQIA